MVLKVNANLPYLITMTLLGEHALFLPYFTTYYT